MKWITQKISKFDFSSGTIQYCVNFLHYTILLVTINILKELVKDILKLGIIIYQN
jgi:hypothetical protein